MASKNDSSKAKELKWNERDRERVQEKEREREVERENKSCWRPFQNENCKKDNFSSFFLLLFKNCKLKLVYRNGSKTRAELDGKISMQLSAYLFI